MKVVQKTMLLHTIVTMAVITLYQAFDILNSYRLATTLGSVSDLSFDLADQIVLRAKYLPLIFIVLIPMIGTYTWLQKKKTRSIGLKLTAPFAGATVIPAVSCVTFYLLDERWWALFSIELLVIGFIVFVTNEIVFLFKK